MKVAVWSGEANREQSAASAGGLSRLPGGGERTAGIGTAQRGSAEPADASLPRKAGSGPDHRRAHRSVAVAQRIDPSHQRGKAAAPQRTYVPSTSAKPK